MVDITDLGEGGTEIQSLLSTLVCPFLGVSASLIFGGIKLGRGPYTSFRLVLSGLLFV